MSALLLCSNVCWQPVLCVLLPRGDSAVKTQPSCCMCCCRYLRPSIQRFPAGPHQEALARQAGFARAVHYPIAFGLMGCLVATKQGDKQ